MRRSFSLCMMCIACHDATTTLHENEPPHKIQDDIHNQLTMKSIGSMVEILL